MERCALVVFSAAGRGHVLARTVDRLRSLAAADSFTARILCLDGLDEELLAREQVEWFTHLRVNVLRGGYYANLLQAVEASEHPFLFACEDDFELSDLPPVSEVAPVLESNPAIVQVRLPKNDYLLLEDKRSGEAAPGIWTQGEFYSLNPHYARTDFLRSALRHCRDHGEGRNIEVVISEWMRGRGGLGACFEPSRARAIHFGHETAGGRSDYRFHTTPAATDGPTSAESAQPEAPSRLPAARVQPRRKAPSSRRARALQTAVELLGKAGYGMWAVVWSTLASPFSRQARAFLRTVWRYWHPDRQTPSCLGIGVDNDC